MWEEGTSTFASPVLPVSLQHTAATHVRSDSHMPSKLGGQHHGQALFESIQNGSYPESEEVIAADLPPTAISDILKLLRQAREDVKVRILI